MTLPVRNASHTIIFGDIVMIEDGANPPDSSGVRYVVRAQDTDYGNPTDVTVALLSLMRAGSTVEYDHTENRQPILRVTVKADDSNLLAMGEKALQLECRRPNTLTWRPPDGAGEDSVFDIVWSTIDLVVDDLAELRRERTYLIRMQALPHARPADLVVTPAQAPTPTYTMVNDASSLTGWTNFAGTYTLSIVSGNLHIAGTHALWNPQVRLTQAIPASSYIAVDVGNAVNLTAISVSGAVATMDLGGGVSRCFLQGNGEATTFRNFIVTGTPPAPSSPASVEILQVQSADAIPFIGTARQKAMSLVPGGSVRTQGSIQVAHATSSLGKTIVYTHPSGSGYLPPLRRWRTSGNTVTADSARVSGAREPIGPSSTVFRVPVTGLPTGRVELWAWMRVTTGTLTRAPAYAIRAVVNNVILADDGGNFPITFTALNTWQLVCLGDFTSPPIRLGPSGLVQIDLNENSGQVEVDEAYLFATELGSLTVVDCGTGTPSAGGPSNYLWIDSPTPDEPMGAIYRGFSADRSDAFHAGDYAEPWDLHDFDPEGTSVFVVTSNALDTATSLEHYPRFHTHVARGT